MVVEKEASYWSGAVITPTTGLRLHMASLVAAVHYEEFRLYYQRKVAEGKNKMCVLNAVRNKLVHRIFACVKENRLYEKNYDPKFG